MLRLLLFFISILVSGAIYCQDSNITLHGKVSETVNNTGLSDATVRVFTPADILIIETHTGKDGIFKCTLKPGSYKLVISFAGYNPFMIHPLVIIGDTLLKDIRLTHEIKNLQAVKVNSKKPLISLSAGKLIMNINESGLGTGNTAWDLIKQAPGVLATDEGAISLQGKAVTIYIDGRISYLNGEQLKNQLTNMQGTQVDKIELISNPSVRYDASGGAVINIKTIRTNKPGLNGSFNAGSGYARYLKYNAGTEINYRKGKINLSGGYDFNHNSNFYKPTNIRLVGQANPLIITEQEEDLRKRSNQAARAGIDLFINKATSAGLMVRGYYNNRDRYVEGSTAFKGGGTVYDSLITTITKGTAVFKSPSVNLFFKTSFDSSKKELVVNADYYRYDQEWKDNFSSDSYDGAGNIIRPGQYRYDNSPFILDIYSMTADYEQTLFKGRLQAGLKSSYINTDNNVQWEIGDGLSWQKDLQRSNYFIYRERINAAYMGYSATCKKWQVDAVLRVENTHVEGKSVTLDTIFTKTYTNLFPSLSISTDINKSNQLNLSYRNSIDRPVYNYVNPFQVYRGQYNYFQGNPNLNPQYSHALEASWIFKKILYARLDYTHTNNYISMVYKQDDATKIITQYYDNYRYADTYSASLIFSKQVNKTWYTSNWATMVYFKSSYGSLTPVKSTPEKFCISYNSFSFPSWKIKMDLTVRYSSAYSDGFLFYKNNNLVNAGVSRELDKGKLIIKLNVADLFQSSFSMFKAIYGNVNNTINSFRDSRSLNINLFYKFGSQSLKKYTRPSKIENETKRINS